MKSSFPEIASKNIEKIRNRAYRLCYPNYLHWVEDLVGDTLLIACEKPPRYAEELESPTQFLFTVLKNLFINRYRTVIRSKEDLAGHTRLKDSDFKLSIDLFEEKGVASYEDTGALFELLNSIDDKQRTVLILSILEDWKHEEISEYLNIPEGTVKSRLMRARDKLWKLNNRVMKSPLLERPHFF
jgi:RNA polymerase sigma-70 factor, ECF subfamily